MGTFLGREGLNTILASTQREAFGRQEPLCACGALYVLRIGGKAI